MKSVLILIMEMGGPTRILQDYNYRIAEMEDYFVFLSFIDILKDAIMQIDLLQV